MIKKSTQGVFTADILPVFIQEALRTRQIAEADTDPALLVEMKDEAAQPQFSLQELVSALKNAMGDEKRLRGTMKDREVLRLMVLIVNGINSSIRQVNNIPRAVITHGNIDLDACVCIALTGVSLENVHFLPAQFPNIPDKCPCCNKKLPHDANTIRILDHPLGLKGRILEDKGGSAARAMLEAKNANPRLLNELDEAETTGKAKPQFSLREIISALTHELRRQGFNDLQKELARIMDLIIYGLIIRYKKLIAAREEIKEIRIEEFHGFRVAILPQGPTPPQLGIALEGDADVSCAIYNDMFDLGVTRYAGRTFPDLTQLTKFLPCWFIHPRGFLCSWGSRKSRAVCLPPEGTPRNQEQLLALMRQVF